MARALVIGFGNPLRNDDGVAWRAAESLAERAGAEVEVITCHQLSPEFAEPISRAAKVILIDAAIPESAESAASGPSGLGGSSKPSSAGGSEQGGGPFNRSAGLSGNEIASASADSPGSIFEREIEPECQSPNCFSHQLSPSTLLACAAELFGTCPKAWLFTVVGADFGAGEKLSDPVAASLPELVRRIEARLAEKSATASRS